MPILQERKSATGSAFILTIPKEYIDKMKWKKGDSLIFSVIDEKSLKIEKV